MNKNSKTVPMYIPVYDRLKAEAERRGRSITEVSSELLTQALDMWDADAGLGLSDADITDTKMDGDTLILIISMEKRIPKADLFKLIRS